PAAPLKHERVRERRRADLNVRWRPRTGLTDEPLMDEHSEGARGGGPSHRSVEIGVALFTAAFALIVVAGSVKAGVGWGAEGPKAGFFPFYVGLVILGSSIINFGAVISRGPDDRLFAEWGQLGQVMAMLVPNAIYVALLPCIGTHNGSELLLAVFMRCVRHYCG